MSRKQGEKRISLSYMQASLGLFVLGLLLLLGLFIHAVVSGGALAGWEGVLGFVGMLMALAGFALPLYGKFVVGSRDKPDYHLGLLLNGPLFLLYVFFYFLGV